MGDNVRSLAPAKELIQFFEHMYGSESGYAYSPTKNPNLNAPQNWTQKFFKWPDEKQELIDHVVRESPDNEVYYSPALFSRPTAKRRSFKCTRFVWAEFDGDLPKDLHDIPEPSLRIRSSTPGHEHWYWELDDFIYSAAEVEYITSRLTYALGADRSGWDAPTVLRPPGTIHHESKRRVTVVKRTQDIYTTGTFASLPEPPIIATKHHEIDLKKVPDVQKILAVQYRWDENDFAFFSKPRIPAGQRSTALTRLGHICMEMGMTDEESLSVLLNADCRWQKFVGRNDQIQRLLGIVAHCRSKYGDLEGSGSKDSFPTYGFREILESEWKVEWIIPGLIHKTGLTVISGPPKLGKTQFTLRSLMCMATGDQFLIWPIPNKSKAVFFSLEMPGTEVKYLYEQMATTLDKEKIELLNTNLITIPLGHMLPLNQKSVQDKVLRFLEIHRPDLVFFDSLGVSIGEDIKNDQTILETLDFVNRYIRQDYGTTVIFVHHNRKSQPGNSKPKELSDLYGSQYIGAQATSIIGLWSDKRGGPIEVNNLGIRMAKDFGTLLISRTRGLDFKVIEDPNEVTDEGNNPLGI
jgi:hypothetical protein